MKSHKTRLSILPKNFHQFLSFFYDVFFDTEVRFGRFRIDFFSPELKIAFEYDGIQHYSIIDRIDSDKRKNQLMLDHGIKLIRWPYYFMPTYDTCKYVFTENFSDTSFKKMLENFFCIDDPSEMIAPGFHTTRNIPANFIKPGITKFLKEMSTAPASLRDQVRYSLQLYCKNNKYKNNIDMVIPEYDSDFMDFYNKKSDEKYLNYFYANL